MYLAFRVEIGLKSSVLEYLVGIGYFGYLVRTASILEIEVVVIEEWTIEDIVA